MDPLSGKKLYVRQRPEGERRVFFDFTCSAMKSGSLIAAGMEASEICEIHELATYEAMNALEKYTATRIRRDGADEDRFTGNFIGASFTHHTSRAGDPQLHTHFLIFNSTYDEVEGKWKVIQPRVMYDATRFATRVYQNAFIREMQQRGFEFVQEACGNGNRKHFQLKDFPVEMIHKYSKRTNDLNALIKARLEEKRKKTGRDIDWLSNKEIDYLVQRYRERKTEKENLLDTTEKQQIAEYCAAAKERCEAKKTLQAPWVDMEQDAYDYAIEHAYERRSVIPELDLLEHVMDHGLEAVIQHGGRALDMNVVQEKLQGDGFLRNGLEVTRQEILDQEVEVIQMVKDGGISMPPIAPRFVPVGLDAEQKEAVKHVVQTFDQVTGTKGLAGSGKTTAMKEIARACKDVPTLFCAPTGSAVDTLRKEGFCNAETLQAFLVNPELQKQYSEGVIVVDEAGLLGIRDMHTLLKIAQERKMRVVFAGDSDQNKPVAQGDALRLIEEYASCRFCEIGTIRRQRVEEYRRAVFKAAKRDPQAAMDLLDSMGWMTDGEKFQEQAAAAYVEQIKSSKDVIMVAPTKKEIQSITEITRGKLKAEYLIGSADVEVETFNSKGWTQAEKRRPARYEKGTRIRFQRAMEHFERYEQVEVEDVVPDPLSLRGRKVLKVRRENGQRVLFDPRIGSYFDVGDSEKLGICAGDHLLLRENHGSRPRQPKPSQGLFEPRTSRHLVNGTLVKVESVTSDRVITLEGGRVLPKNYRNFTHGYCVTSYSSQGKTADTVILAANASSLAVNREQFYVSISRGRDTCLIFTDNKARLKANICRSNERTAAIELMRHQCTTNTMELALEGTQPVPVSLKPTHPKETPIILPVPQEAPPDHDDPQIER